MRNFELAELRSSLSDTELAVHVDSLVESSRVCRRLFEPALRRAYAPPNWIAVLMRPMFG